MYANSNQISTANIPTHSHTHTRTPQPLSNASKVSEQQQQQQQHKMTTNQCNMEKLVMQTEGKRAASTQYKAEVV